MTGSLLDNKRILLVDDEADVLESLEELLSMCHVVKATSFEQARDLMESEYFDMAILDIMGVDGFKLLEIAKNREIIPVMLTAHALSLENTAKSYRKGAASYVPKEHITDIATYLTDILEAQQQGKPFWWRWLDRFGSFYDRKFGLDWKEKDKDFVESLKYYDRI